MLIVFTVLWADLFKILKTIFMNQTKTRTLKLFGAESKPERLITNLKNLNSIGTCPNRYPNRIAAFGDSKLCRLQSVQK